ncbi:MAG: transposase family protein [Aulosira sp. DedQUE10]|nr:transposase family protein [Aulosira sp. DedQUE10]
MIIMPDGRDIVDVVAGEPGPKSDITIFREYRSKFDPQQKFKGDKAYLGEDLITTPIKKPNNRELTTEQKEQNKAFSAKRIFVEHRIRSVKIFRVVQERFRLNPQKYEQVILTICGESALREGNPPQATANPKGLVRFRIRALILPAEIHVIA